jgi:SAM-dependent MidA family methyltransferase
VTDEAARTGGGAGDVEVGVRRVPELDPVSLPDSDPELVARVRADIERTGPMTFARFMELALYDPDRGYYMRLDAPARGPGRGGDFLTAPESHPIFGGAIARHLESVWEAVGRPGRFVVREHGAGRGALAAGILDGLRRSGSPLGGAIRYQPIEASPARLEVLRLRLAAAGLEAPLEPATDQPEAGVILANELLDALPVHRVEGGPNGELLERFVDLADHVANNARLEEVAGPPSTPALGARLTAEAIQLEPGQVAEICLAIDDWIPAATPPLERGELLLIDYGHPAAALYDPGRGSTLRAYHRHRVHADPFLAIGRQDLTAHVDLTAVERAAQRAGLTPLGRTTQARFLERVGAGELLVAMQADPTTTLATYLAAKSALVRMLDPRATGGFAVLGFGRDLPSGAPLRGFGPAR